MSLRALALQSKVGVLGTKRLTVILYQRFTMADLDRGRPLCMGGTMVGCGSAFIVYSQYLFGVRARSDCINIIVANFSSTDLGRLLRLDIICSFICGKRAGRNSRYKHAHDSANRTAVRA